MNEAVGSEGSTFLISVAAELAGMHVQTLRTYDRLGLVSPTRSSGGGRRYSERDVDLLREVRITQECTITLPLIGTIDLRDRTVRQAEEIIRSLYDRDYLVNPQVNLTVLEYTQRTVQVRVFDVNRVPEITVASHALVGAEAFQ